MNRRKFLGLAGLGSIGLLLPGWVRRLWGEKSVAKITVTFDNSPEERQKILEDFKKLIDGLKIERAPVAHQRLRFNKNAGKRFDENVDKGISLLLKEADEGDIIWIPDGYEIEVV